MTTEQLLLDRSDDGIVITTTATANEQLPTVVINLGPDLTVEINPAANAPLRIASDNYPQARQRLEAILGSEATSLIDSAGPGTHKPALQARARMEQLCISLPNNAGTWTGTHCPWILHCWP